MAGIRRRETTERHSTILKQDDSPFYDFKSDEIDRLKCQRAKFNYHHYISANKKHPELEIRFDGDVIHW